jgi:hypothetical protein
MFVLAFIEVVALVLRRYGMLRKRVNLVIGSLLVMNIIFALLVAHSLIGSSEIPIQAQQNFEKFIHEISVTVTRQEVSQKSLELSKLLKESKIEIPKSLADMQLVSSIQPRDSYEEMRINKILMDKTENLKHDTLERTQEPMSLKNRNIFLFLIVLAFLFMAGNADLQRQERKLKRA